MLVRSKHCPDMVNTMLASPYVSMASDFEKQANYRLEKLEEKVDKHNNLVERMAVAERDITELKEKK